MMKSNEAPPSGGQKINLGVHKHLRRPAFERLIMVQILEHQHRALMLVAEGASVDIDELNNTVRSLLSQLVDVVRNDAS